ncbi:hypothetical protein ACIU2E_RS25525, partial [Escherichia coli]
VFNISNSLLDEIDVDNEGRIIESCLIRYFDPKLQDDDKESKRSDLNKMFMDLVENKKLKKYTLIFNMKGIMSISAFTLKLFRRNFIISLCWIFLMAR